MERKVTPSELALFSRSPVIGAWWEQLNKLDSKRAPKPKVDLLDQLLFESGHKHEELFIRDIKANGKKVKQLSGKILLNLLKKLLM